MRIDAVMSSTLGHAAAAHAACASYDSRMLPEPTSPPRPAYASIHRSDLIPTPRSSRACVRPGASSPRRRRRCSPRRAGPTDAAAELEPLVERRVAGEPLEQVLGWAEFAGLRILLEPGVFVPRRRTEFLAAEAASSRGRRGRDALPVVVDLCCGAGAIGAAVADAAARRARRGRRRPRRRAGRATEPRTARRPRRRGRPLRRAAGDLLGRIDVLAVNAPYVPTDEIAMMPPEARDHEARVALDGGGDGLDVHRRVAASARAWLAPGGHC